MSEKIRLNDYAGDRFDVVLFFTSVGIPGGDHVPLGSQDYVFDYSWLDLEGTIDKHGDWKWDGKGNPTDSRSNNVTKMQAYVDQEKWRSLTENS